MVNFIFQVSAALTAQRESLSQNVRMTTFLILVAEVLQTWVEFGSICEGLGAHKSVPSMTSLKI